MRTRTLAGIAGIVGLAAGCGSFATAPRESTWAGSTDATSRGYAPGDDAAEGGDWGGDPSPEPVTALAMADADGKVAAGLEAEASLDEEAPVEATRSRSDHYVRRVRPSAGLLTAGAYRDLENWRLWTGLHEQGEWRHWAFAETARKWKLHTQGRVEVHVQQGSRPVADARVVLLRDHRPVWEARSDNRGRAELWSSLAQPYQGQQPQGGGYSVHVEAGGVTQVVELGPMNQPGATQDPLTIHLLQAAPEPADVLDLMFVVDVTGSMSDELRFLQGELENVIGRVQRRNGQSLRIRTSVNFYRDHGDAFLVRPYAFSEDTGWVKARIAEQSAGGGGDFEEAVDEALLNGVTQHRWSESARARLLFLVLDAPPHCTPDGVHKIQTAIRGAAQRGIRVVPLVASGIDKPTEALMRSLAVVTGGNYVFLTDHSGIGNSHMKPTIGDYSVEMLNDLLVRLINESVAKAGALK